MGLKFVARVARVKNPHVHFPDCTVLPDAATLEIRFQHGAWFLYRWAPDGAFGGDTWHEIFADAQHQAELDYELEPEGFVEVEG